MQVSLSGIGQGNVSGHATGQNVASLSLTLTNVPSEATGVPWSLSLQNPNYIREPVLVCADPPPPPPPPPHPHPPQASMLMV